MGRKAKGVSKINDAYCIEYSQMVSMGLIHKEAYMVERIIEWRTEVAYEAVTIEGTYNPVNQSNLIRLNYLKWSEDGVPTHEENLVAIEQIQSNLGKGKVGYFICPVAKQRCRKLYKNENAKNWQCRKAFESRLYYNLQLCSTMQSYNQKYHAYKSWIDKYSERKVLHKHKGKPTKKHLRLKLLETKKAEMGEFSLSPLTMPLCIRKLFPKGLVDDFYSVYG